MRYLYFLLLFLGNDKVCIQGVWEDGVCICSQGYEDDVELSSNLALNPIYCSKQSFVTVIRTQSGPELSREVLHHGAIAVSNHVISAYACKY